MDEVCRVCSKRFNKLVETCIKQDSEEQFPCVAEMLNEWTDGLIVQNVALPEQQICESCLLAAQSAYNLRQACNQAVNNTKEVCSVCWGSSITLVDICAKRQQPEGQPSVAEMLNECLGIEAKFHKPIARQICHTCILTVQDSFKFKRKCENNRLPIHNQQSDEFILPDNNITAQNEWEKGDYNVKSEVQNETIRTRVSEEESPLVEDIKEEEIWKDAEVEPKATESDEIMGSDEHYLSDSLVKEETRLIEFQPTSSQDTADPQIAVKKNKYECDICHKTFNRQMFLTIHKRIHTGERPYKCSDCSKDFISEVALSRHMMSHSEERPYPCQHCPKAFKFKDLLKKHVSLHSGKRSFQCPYCTYSFVRKAHLTSHIQTHNEEGLHECPHCPMTFSRKEPLVDHIRIHTGERPFKCPHCPMTFSLKQSLGFHIPEHTGEYPKKCPHCALSYGSMKTLKRHMLIHAKSTGEAEDNTLK